MLGAPRRGSPTSTSPFLALHRGRRGGRAHCWLRAAPIGRVRGARAIAFALAAALCGGSPRAAGAARCSDFEENGAACGSGAACGAACGGAVGAVVGGLGGRRGLIRGPRRLL